MGIIRVRVDNAAGRILTLLPREFARSLQRWTTKGRQLVRGEMVRQIRSRQQTRGRTGRLSNSVTAASDRTGFVVGPTVSYAPFVDQPTRPHIIRPRNAKALAFAGRGERLGHTRTGKAFSARQVGSREVRGPVQFARSVRHPGTKGMRFIDHTTRATEAPVTDLLAKELDDGLHRVGAK